MKFCSECGRPLEQRVPDGDDRRRHVCGSCGRVHYQNPKMITGCLPRWKDGRILLCRRSIEPRFGLWTLPSGFMENGETLEEGALRETREESRVECRIERLFSVFSLAHVDQIYFLFLAEMLSLDYGPTPESSEVELFAPEDIPWSELAFRPVEFALRKYVSPEENGEAAHLGEYRRGPRDPWILGHES